MAWSLRRAPKNAPKRIRDGLRPSPNEERYLLAETMTGQVYATPNGTRIQGPFDVEGWVTAIRETCDRHEARRTGFEPVGDGTFRKYVEDRATVHVERRSMPGASMEEVQAAVDDYMFRPGDFSPATLHRFMVIELGPDDRVVVSAFHHATSDGVTSNAFTAELMARLFGGEIPDAPAQYSDYWDHDWVNSDAYKAGEAFWNTKLRGLADHGLWPEDLAAPATRSRLGVVVQLPPELIEATRRAADQIGVTHFSFFYAAYVVLLSRLSGDSQVCTSFQSAGRRAMPGANSAHGVFSNKLILAAQVDEAESVASLAARLRAGVREAIEHEIVPYHHVVRSTGVRPQYAINWLPQMAETSVQFGDLTFTPLAAQNQDDDDLNLRFATYADQTRLALYYNPATFSRERIVDVTEQFAALAAELARDVNLPIRDAAPRTAEPRTGLPDPAEILPRSEGELIHATFLMRALERPEAIAVLQGDERLTYADLEARSRALAGRLRAQGVSAGDRVAILADRGPQLVVSMLAAARLGAVFVVLDSAYPELRLASLLEIAAPRALVLAGDETLCAAAHRLAHSHRLAVLEATTASEGPADETGLDAACPDDVAYMLFTSGSTGQPKGVACSHRPLSRFVAWQAETFDLTAADRFTLISGLSHDPMLRDVFTALSLGATVTIPEAEVITQPGALAQWMRRVGATVAHLTPAMGQLMTAEGERSPHLPDLRRVFWGGDLLRPQIVQQLARIAPKARQTNFYGATETPQAVSWFDIDVAAGPQWKSVPIGVGRPGFQVLVVDADKQPLPAGHVGQIAVRSNDLSLGYVQAGEVEEDEHRGCDPQGVANIYYTGDRGLHLPDGAVLLVGREDEQVKVRGHRVELPEITATLLAHEGVRSAYTLAIGEGAGLRIAAFVTVRHRRPPEVEALRNHLAERLPGYMSPNELQILDSLPTTPNGKVDRIALLARLEAARAPQPVQEAKGSVERSLIEAWRGVLNQQTIGRTSSFAALGGDSLSYVQAYLASEEIVGELPSGWQLMSVAELAALAKPRNRFWSGIDIPIVLRAVSIFLVVSGHFSFLRYGGGATSALMMVSGFMFGGLPLSAAFQKQEARPVLRTFLNLFIPTAALSIGLWILRLGGSSPPSPVILLFDADIENYQAAPDASRELYLWYVHGMLHMFLMLYVALLLLKAAKGFKIGPWRFLAGLFVVACLGRFVLPEFLDSRFYMHTAPSSAGIALLPTSNLATIVIGAMIATATLRGEKLALGVMIPIYAALSAWLFGLNNGVWILLSGLLMLGAPRLTLPRVVNAALFAIAGASLWIYVTHMAVHDILLRLNVLTVPGMAVAVAVAGGVLLWMVWRRVVALGLSFIKRPAMIEADAAV